jgi:hypothetical protein
MTVFDDELVYHYTDFESFLNVVNSESLWASDLDAVNDPAELHSAIGLLRDIFAVYGARLGLEGSAIQQLRGLKYLPPLREFARESQSECQRFR